MEFEPGFNLGSPVFNLAPVVPFARAPEEFPLITEGEGIRHHERFRRASRRARKTSCVAASARDRRFRTRDGSSARDPKVQKNKVRPRTGERSRANQQSRLEGGLLPRFWSPAKTPPCGRLSRGTLWVKDPDLPRACRAIREGSGRGSARYVAPGNCKRSSCH